MKMLLASLWIAGLEVDIPAQKHDFSPYYQHTNQNVHNLIVALSNKQLAVGHLEILIPLEFVIFAELPTYCNSVNFQR